MKKQLFFLSLFIVSIINTLSAQQPGKLDAIFGDNGIVRTSIGSNFNLSGSEINSFFNRDGSFYVVLNFGGERTVLLKKLADSTIDQSFGLDGLSDVASLKANAAVRQPDGKIIVVGSNGSLLAVVRYHSDGSLDNTFGENGLKKFQLGDESYANDVAIQPDGKVVIIGISNNLEYDGYYSSFLLARLNADGTPDQTFNGSGIIRKSFSEYDITYSVGILSTGQILTVAGGSDGGHMDRFNGDGSADKSFQPYYGFSDCCDGRHPLIILPDDKIIVGTGRTLSRYDADGNFAESYFTNYTVTTLQLQQDGKFLVRGSDNTSMILERYVTSFIPDDTFGTNGKISIPLNTIETIPSSNTIFLCTAVQDNGKILAAGKAWNGNDFDFAIARYNVDGSLDNSFGVNGKQLTDFSGDDFAKTIAIQPDGKILVAGSAIVRYNIDGSLDASFSQAGILSNWYIIENIKVQKDGKIVIAGGRTPGGYDDPRFSISRFENNGSPDLTFNQTGEGETPNFDLGLASYATAIAFQADGKIIVAGVNYDYGPLSRFSDIALVRYNLDGTLDGTFYIPTNSSNQITSFGLDIQGDGTIVVAGNDQHSLILDSYDTNGKAIKSRGYGTANNFGQSSAAMVLQSDDKIIVAGNSSSGHFSVARFNKDLSIDNTFSEDGVEVTEVSKVSDGVSGLAVDGDKLYAAGSGQFPGNLGVLARYTLAASQEPPSMTISIPDSIVKYSAPALIKINAIVANIAGNITKVRFYSGATQIHTETEAPYGFLWADVSEGNYTLTAKAYDDQGNIITSNAIDVTVVSQNVAPVVYMTNPMHDTTYTGISNIRLIARAKDPNGKISKVEFFSGTQLLRTEYYYPYSYNWNNVPEGTYTITAVATDDEGLSTTSDPILINVTAPLTTFADKSALMKEDISSALRLSLSPNPARDILQVSIDGNQNKPSDLFILSASGAIIKSIGSFTTARQLRVDVSSLAKGVYFIKIFSGSKVMHKQFVKL